MVGGKCLVSFHKEGLVGIVHPDGSHFIEGKDAQEKYQEQQKPSKAQDAFCQTGKKGVGAAEIFRDDSWIHGSLFNSVHAKLLIVQMFF